MRADQALANSQPGHQTGERPHIDSIRNGGVISEAHNFWRRELALACQQRMQGSVVVVALANPKISYLDPPVWCRLNYKDVLNVISTDLGLVLNDLLKASGFCGQSYGHARTAMLP